MLPFVIRNFDYRSIFLESEETIYLEIDTNNQAYYRYNHTNNQLTPISANLYSYKAY